MSLINNNSKFLYSNKISLTYSGWRRIEYHNISMQYLITDYCLEEGRNFSYKKKRKERKCSIHGIIAEQTKKLKSMKKQQL